MRTSILAVVALLAATSACDYAVHVADLRPDVGRADAGTLSETPMQGSEVVLFVEGTQILGEWLAYVDLDGDGMDDIVIPDRQSTDMPSRGGGLYVMYGRPLRLGGRVDLATEAVHVVGPAHAAYGNGVIPVRGDFDGDGREDLAVAVGYGDATSGTVHLIWGSTARLSGEPFIEDVATTLAGLPYFEGTSLASLGDLDGDGCDELSIGGESAGVLVVRGSSTRWASAPAQIATRFVTAAPGVVDGVRAADDLDGDGARDVIAVDQAGHFAIFYGPIALTGVHALEDAAATIEVSLNGPLIAVAADLDGDGIHDIAIADPHGGAPALDPHVLAAQVDVFLGTGRRFVGTYLADDAALRLSTGPDDANGVSISAGDANGDGRVDLLVGVPGFDGDGVPALGDAYLVSGPIVGGLLAHAAVHWPGHALPDFAPGVPVSELLGTAVALDGDFDGDGLADALISAPTNDIGARGEHRAYLSYGVR